MELKNIVCFATNLLVKKVRTRKLNFLYLKYSEQILQTEVNFNSYLKYPLLLNALAFFSLFLNQLLLLRRKTLHKMYIACQYKNTKTKGVVHRKNKQVAINHTRSRNKHYNTLKKSSVGQTRGRNTHTHGLRFVSSRTRKIMPKQSTHPLSNVNFLLATLSLKSIYISTVSLFRTSCL